ncbi:MAG TPA: phage portal protein [Mucilaginibacter sp.]|jgi:lambda family phage portal protein
MDPITKLISIFSPSTAAKRVRSQVALRMMQSEIRKFDGAGHGRRFGNFGYGNTTQNQQIIAALPTLRERSEDMARNNGYAKNAIRRVGNNVVGTGIMATPVSKNPNPEAAKKEEDLVKKVWKEWAESTDCDFDGMQNFYGIQKMIAKTAAKSGACIARKVWKRYKKNSMSLEIQLLHPSFLDRSKTGVTFENGEYLFNGIQFDKFNKKKAYWIYDSNPFENKIQSQSVPAEDIRYIFDIEDPGQVDGLPFNSSVILPMKDFDEYTDAQLIRQKIAACFAVFITNDNEALGSNAIESKNDQLEKVEPGIIQNLKRGETISFANPPTTEGFGEYSRQSLLLQAAGIGLSYEAYTGDLTNVNFSSGRMGWIEMHRNVEDWQWNMVIAMFCNDAWKWFTKAAFLSGLIPDQNIGVTWTPPRREMIDPVKEGKALAEMVRNGFISWQDAVRSLGYSPEEILVEMKKDAQGFDEAGLMPTSDPRFDPTRKTDKPDKDAAGKKVKKQKINLSKTE